MKNKDFTILLLASILIKVSDGWQQIGWIIFLWLWIIYIILKFYNKKQNAFRQTSVIQLELIINHIKIKGEFTMVSLTSTQQVSGQLQPTNRLGAPAPVEAGTVLIQSSDPNVVAVEVDPEDETKFKLKAKNAGVSTIQFAADADLGEGVAPITGSVNVEVVAAAAQGFGVSMGEPEEQPAPEV